MKKTLLALALGTVASASFAGPADYVYTPTVEYGEREIDLKFGREELDEDHESAGSLGLGWGVTPFWFTEAYAKWEKEPGEGTRLEAYEWENKFQLTQTGRFPVDLGLITEIEIPRESDDAKEFKFGPLLQTEFDRLQLNANALFERKFGGDREPGEEREWEMQYQWQVKYRWQPAFEFGAQGFGELGEWNDWEPTDRQEHLAGPAVFGKIALGGGKIAYNAAVLAGLNDNSPDSRFRLQVEYEF